MAKKLREIVKGVKASKEVPNTLGGYKPKAGDEQKFVAKHKIEKYADRAGNGDDVYNASNVKHAQEDEKEERHGYKHPEDKKVNEAKTCNMSEAGTMCEVHGMSDCSKGGKKVKVLKEKDIEEETEELDEVWTVTHSGGKVTQHATQKLAMKHAREVGGKVSATHGAKGVKASVALAKTMKADKIKRPWDVKEEVNLDESIGDHEKLKSYAEKHGGSDGKDLHHAAELIRKGDLGGLKSKLRSMDSDPRDKVIDHVNKKYHLALGYSVKEEVEQVDEVLSKKAPAGEWIKDFQKSDNPKFAGKSKEKRKQMALAAYYAKQRNEEVEQTDESLVQPLLGSKDVKKKKGAKEQVGPDTPMTFPNMSVDVNTGHNV